MKTKPDDTTTRRLHRIDAELKWVGGDALFTAEHLQFLLAEVSRLREALADATAEEAHQRVHKEEYIEFLKMAEADVSRLQQENALLKRSLEMLTKQLDEKDERIDELVGLVGEVD